MLDSARHNRPDLDDRKVVYLEFVAASAIFVIIGLVLYMIFTFKPQ